MGSTSDILESIRFVIFPGLVLITDTGTESLITAHLGEAHNNYYKEISLDE